jgi:BirA family biotin operon repressor/biotin-[acetyl-CoA-carboxylase] ligase
VPAASPTWDLDRDRLAGTRFGTVRFFDELGSTNSELVEDARAGAPEGLVIVADHQTAGRGRLGRTWSAEPGTALLVSALLRPPLPISEVPVVLMAAGLAACDGVEAAAGFRPKLKWPNDLVVGDRKLAGLLAERDGEALVVGVGCNVNWDGFPPDLADAATSCNLEAGHPVDRDRLLTAFLDGFAAMLARGDDVLGEYRARLATLGRRVRVEPLRGETLLGTALDVTGDGALVVRDDAGADHTVVAADVVHLR